MLHQKRDVSSDDKEKFPYDIVKMALPPEAQLAADSEVRLSAPNQQPGAAVLLCDWSFPQELGEHDDAPGADDLVEASTNQELDKSPNAALHVQEAILKELTNEDVHKVNMARFCWNLFLSEASMLTSVISLQVSCYDQDVVSEMEAEPKELGAEHHATQTLTFTDSIGEVKDEAAPGWSAAAADMKFEYLLYGHREQLACQVCGKTFLDENRLR